MFSIARVGFLTLCVCWLGCKSDKSGEAKAKAAEPGSAPAATQKAVRGDDPAQAPQGAATASGTSAGHSYDRATLCQHDCLLLIDHDFHALADGKYCELCKEYDEDACDLDWPSSDMMACESWDMYRNCVYAGYGKTFSKATWQQAFADQPWYHPDPNFDESKMSTVARANVALMKKHADECRAETPESGRALATRIRDAASRKDYAALAALMCDEFYVENDNGDDDGDEAPTKQNAIKRWKAEPRHLKTLVRLLSGDCGENEETYACPGKVLGSDEYGDAERVVLTLDGDQWRWCQFVSE